MSELFRRVSSALHDIVEGQAVVVDGPSQQIVTLNEVGSLIWEELDQPRSLDDLVTVCSSQYPDVSTATLATDIEEFLRSAQAQRLITADS